MNLAIAAAIAAFVLLLVILVWYFTRGGSGQDTEEEERSLPPSNTLFAKGRDEVVHNTGPLGCRLMDVIERKGLVDRFDYGNRALLRALVDVVDAAVDEASKKPSVRAVMRGMDANLSILLEGVDRQHLVGLMQLFDSCARYEDEGGGDFAIEDQRCVLEQFGGTKEELATLLADTLNQVRSNAIKYNDRFVFGAEPGTNMNEMIVVRDEYLREYLKQLVDAPSVDPQLVLRQFV